MDSPLSSALTEYMTTAVPKIARGLHRNYRYLETDDLSQEMWAGALKRAKHFNLLMLQGDLGIIDKELRRTGWRVCKEDERRRRAERAKRLGYEPEDEQFYTMGLLRALLPAYLDGGVASEPPRGRSQARSGLLSEGGDYLAMMTDLSRGMACIKPWERSLIETYYGAPQGDDPDSRFTRTQLASSMGMTLGALEVRVNRAVRSLQRELGGENPWRRGNMVYDAESYTNRTASRSVDPVTGVPGRPSVSRERALRSVRL